MLKTNNQVEDLMEQALGERIGQVLNESKSRKDRHYAAEKEYLNQLDLDEKRKEVLDHFVEDLLAWNYEDARAAYCAGMEDGIRMARAVLTV